MAKSLPRPKKWVSLFLPQRLFLVPRKDLPRPKKDLPWPQKGSSWPKRDLPCPPPLWPWPQKVDATIDCPKLAASNANNQARKKWVRKSSNKGTKVYVNFRLAANGVAKAPIGPIFCQNFTMGFGPSDGKARGPGEAPKRAQKAKTKIYVSFHFLTFTRLFFC